MRVGLARALAVVIAGLALAACSGGKLANPFSPAAAPQAAAPQAEATTPAPTDVTASTNPKAPPPLGVSPEVEKGLLGSDVNDDLALGKKQYRAQNFGLAERYFRHAAELHPRDAEAWLGLAASYDRLRRFDLADRAYAQAIRIVGRTAVILNNQGYSYMLRGDYRRARATLMEAERLDPGNKYIANNLQLLDASARTGKAIE
jgi:tetratricopeptide (TPR) repeat protein